MIIHKIDVVSSSYTFIYFRHVFECFIALKSDAKIDWQKTYPTRYSVDVISLKVPAIKTDVVTKTLHDKGFMILDEAMSDTSLLTVGQELENRVDKLDDKVIYFRHPFQKKRKI